MATVTTTDAIYRTILAQLQTAYAAVPFSLAASRVYLVASPFFEDKASTYVQIVPGTLTALHNVGGAVGLVEEQFSVVCWQRAFQDPGLRATILLSKASAGVLALVSAARTKLILNLLNDGVNDLAAVPVTLVANDPQLTGLAPMGWVGKAETYQVSYKIDVPNLPKVVT